MLASAEEIDHVLPAWGVGRVILAARDLVYEAMRCGISSSRVDLDDSRLHRYLQQKLGLRANEALLAIFADPSGRYLADEVISEGTGRRLLFDARGLLRRAFALNASGLLVAHNHPSGDARASSEDQRATEIFKEVCSTLEIELIDHLIVTRHSIYSMRRAALL